MINVINYFIHLLKIFSTMKNRLLFLLMAAALVMACVGRSYNVEVIPVQDNSKPRLMARALFSEAPDSIFESLGLQNGIPSSVCAFLVKADKQKNLLKRTSEKRDFSLFPTALKDSGSYPCPK